MRAPKFIGDRGPRFALANRSKPRRRASNVRLLQPNPPLVTRVPTDQSGTAGGNLQYHCCCLRQGADQVVGAAGESAACPPLRDEQPRQPALARGEVALDRPQLVAGNRVLDVERAPEDA
jgi:hypothetical protein